MKEISEQLKRLRGKRGLTQDVLAERLHVTRQAVSNWETGKNLPDLESLQALAEALEVGVEDLLGEPGREKPHGRPAAAVILSLLTGAGFLAYVLLAGLAQEYGVRTYDTRPYGYCRFLLAPLVWALAGAAVSAAIRVWRDIRPSDGRARLALFLTGAAAMAVYTLGIMGVLGSVWAANPFLYGLLALGKRPALFLLPGALLFCGWGGKAG